MELKRWIPAATLLAAFSLWAQQAPPSDPLQPSSASSNRESLTVTNFVASDVIVTNGTLVSAWTNNVPPTSILGSNIVVRPITLGEAIQMALENNYNVQIVSLSPEVARFRLESAYGYYEPELQVSSGYSFRRDPPGVRFDPTTGSFLPRPVGATERDFLGVGIGGYAPTGLRYGIDSQISHTPQSAPFDTEGDWMLTLQQPLLRNAWIDANRRAILLSKNSLRYSEWGLRQMIISTITSVEDAYYELIRRRENIKVARAALEISGQLLRENRKRVEVGALAVLDEKETEAEVARTVADLLQTEQGYAVALNTLKNLITQDFASYSQVVFDPVENLVAVPAEPELSESWKNGLTMRPDLQQLRLDLESRNIDLKFLKNQIWPALDLRATYGQTSRDTSYGRALDDLRRDDNHSYSIAGVLTIPLGGRSPRNEYRAAKLVKEQAVLQYKALEQQIMVDIDNAVKLLKSRFQQVEATRQARIFSREALLAEQKKYENGKSTSYNVMQKQRDLTAARFEEIAALADYNRALAALAFSEGTTLQRHNLSLNPVSSN